MAGELAGELWEGAAEDAAAVLSRRDRWVSFGLRVRVSGGELNGPLDHGDLSGPLCYRGL